MSKGKEAAQRVLNKMHELFKSFATRGCDWAPQYNEKTNEILYFAQGDRDIKYRYPDLFEQPDMIYYRRDLIPGTTEDYHLTKPHS